LNNCCGKGELGELGKLGELGEQGYIFPEQGDAILMKDATPRFITGTPKPSKILSIEKQQQRLYFCQ